MNVTGQNIFPNLLLNIVTLSVLLSGCVTNKKIVIDERSKISDAPRWEKHFEKRDSGSGIIIEIIEPNITSLDSMYLNLSFWSYPLDTITIAHTKDNQLQSLPGNYVADVTRIYYELKNKSIKMSVVIDYTNQKLLDIEPNTYLVLLESITFVPIWIRDVEVKQGYWSVVKTKIYREPVIIY